MLTALSRAPIGDAASPATVPLDELGSAIWVDLLDPTPEEIRAVESALGIQLPTQREAQEIEVSSRLYTDRDAAFMTATVIARADASPPETTPVTFVYQPQCLVTLRFADPVPLISFAAKYRRSPGAYPSAQRILMGLIDEITDRVGDILETVGADLNRVSGTVFSEALPQPSRKQSIDYTAMLTRIGQNGERAASARESLTSISRLLAFLPKALQGSGSERLDEQWQTVGADVVALADHAAFLSSKVNFFLDATLGRINIEQNTIVKLFSVLAVVLLPPTLVASIYGMNFAYMPELKWLLGYPLSLVLMLLAAVVPYLWFKRKGWL